MVSFNIIASCVTRDICTPLIEEGYAQVLQYTAFHHPISVVSEKGNFEVKMEELKDYSGKNFEKRSMCNDINKTVFDYAFKKKSDYLLINMINTDRGLIRKGNHYITNFFTVKKNRDNLNRDYGMGDYEVISDSDITDSMLEEALDKFAERILEHYTPDQVILHKYSRVFEYISNGKILNFKKVKWLKYHNDLSSMAYDMIESKLKNCHVIEFPDFVIGDASHRLGLLPTHYVNEYYEYGAEALKIITQKLPLQKEKEALKQLKEQYSCKFELIRRNLELNKLKIRFKQLTKIKALSDNKDNLDSKQIIDTAKSINNMESYTELLKTLKQNYLIVVAVRDTPGKNFSDIIQKIKEFGFTNLTNEDRQMYVGVSYKNKILCDNAGEGVENVEYNNENLNLSVLSSSYERQNKAEIIIDGIDYAVNMRSLNFVIYDTENKVLIDSIGFDNFSINEKFVRNKAFPIK